MTENHYFSYSFSFSSSLFLGGKSREKSKKITSVVVKSHAFLLDPIKLATGRKENKYTPPVNNVDLGLISKKS